MNARYTELQTSIRICYTMADIPGIWCITYQVTGTIQHLINAQKNKTGPNTYERFSSNGSRTLNLSVSNGGRRKI